MNGQGDVIDVVFFLLREGRRSPYQSADSPSVPSVCAFDALGKLLTLQVLLRRKNFRKWHPTISAIKTYFDGFELL